MRLAYLDCFAGIAGDMFLAALVHAGVPKAVLEDATAALNIGATLTFETVDRSGISSTKAHVLDHGKPVEDGAGHVHPHKPGTPQTDDRSLSQIRQLITASALNTEVKALAIRVFEILGEAESKVHNVPAEEIHFHEVGAVDALVDIVASCAGLLSLRIDAWHCSPLNVGGGIVQCAHGNFPVPAPAVAELLRGVPTYSAHLAKELTTPTGAALIRALNPSFGPQPAMIVASVGYGAGTRNPEAFANVLRLSIGTSSTSTEETVTVLETALDDLSPQIIAHVASTALAEGALDVMLTPVLMKKGRPGTLLTLLCSPIDRDRFTSLLLRETSTLGIRIREERRITLDRHHRTVETPYGPIRIKLGSRAGETLNAAPEFEDCRAAAETHKVPLKLVMQAAIAAFDAAD